MYDLFKQIIYNTFEFLNGKNIKPKLREINTLYYKNIEHVN